MRAVSTKSFVFFAAIADACSVDMDDGIEHEQAFENLMHQAARTSTHKIRMKQPKCTGVCTNPVSMQQVDEFSIRKDDIVREHGFGIFYVLS